MTCPCGNTNITNVGCNQNNLLHCHFCTWTTRVISVEQMEFALANHLMTVHRRTLLWREESDTKKRTEIPKL